MELMKETKRMPRLTEFKVQPTVVKKPIKLIKEIKEVKWSLNGVILICFVVFLIFFLYNCKYGMFKTVDLEPYAFNVGSR
jgi:hypothetical protein